MLLHKIEIGWFLSIEKKKDFANLNEKKFCRQKSAFGTAK